MSLPFLVTDKLPDALLRPPTNRRRRVRLVLVNRCGYSAWISLSPARSSTGHARASIENDWISLLFIYIPKPGNSTERTVPQHREPQECSAPSPAVGWSTCRAGAPDWPRIDQKPYVSPRRVRPPQGNPRRESQPAPLLHSGTGLKNLALPI